MSENVLRDLGPSSQAVEDLLRDPGPDNQAEAIEDCRCNFCLCGQEISHVTVGRDWRPLDGYSPSWPVPYHKTCGLMGEMDGLARPRTCPRCGRRRGVRRARK